MLYYLINQENSGSIIQSSFTIKDPTGKQTIYTDL